MYSRLRPCSKADVCNDRLVQHPYKITCDHSRRNVLISPPALVTYMGRDRRPVWCSARCRVEASIERRGNRIVGVEPRVITVVPPKKRLSRWEADRRREIERTLTPDIVVTMVAREPYLLMKVSRAHRKRAPGGPCNCPPDRRARTCQDGSSPRSRRGRAGRFEAQGNTQARRKRVGLVAGGVVGAARLGAAVQPRSAGDRRAASRGRRPLHASN